MKLRYLAVFLLGAMATVASAADSQLLKLVMPDARVVSGVDVDHIKTTPFGQFFLSQFLVDSGFKELVDATGFDPRREPMQHRAQLGGRLLDLLARHDARAQPGA